MEKTLGAKAWLTLAVLSVIWGSSFILIKRGLDVFSADEVGALRILSAGLFLSPIAFSKLKHVNQRNFIWLLSVGFVGSFIPAFLFATAQTEISSSLAGILNALTPIFVLIFGIIFFKQSIKMLTLLGLVIGFSGSFLLINSGPNGLGEVNYYALLIVVATMCYGFNVNLIKFKLADISAVSITSVSLLLVLPIASVYLFFGTDFIHKLSTVEGAWLSTFYVALLGIMGTSIALVMFNGLVKVTTPVFTSMVTYLIPVVALIWGILDGEAVGIIMGIGFFTILSGVYLINKGEKS